MRHSRIGHLHKLQVARLSLHTSISHRLSHFNLNHNHHHNITTHTTQNTPITFKMPSTTKTRLCLISDTHTLPPNPPTTSTGYRNPLPPSNILLHAGDITKVSYRIEHEAMISMLKSAPAELKLIIAGNHDISLDPGYFYSPAGSLHRPRRVNRDVIEDPEESPAEIRRLYTSPEAVEAGIRYLDEGSYTFRVPSTGATLRVYASPYQPEFCRWAFGYPRHVDRFNPPRPDLETETGSGGARGKPENPVPDFPNVDVMLTHGPPMGILDETFRRGERVGCEHLLTAVKRARPRMHVFGHIHEAYGAGRMDWEVVKEGSDSVSGPADAGAGFQGIKTDPEEVLEHRCAYHDASSTGRPLRFGDETLFVNASVVTLRYQPLNAPWLVDLDLPVEET